MTISLTHDVKTVDGLVIGLVSCLFVGDLLSVWHTRMWEIKAGRKIIWSPDPGLGEVLTAVLLCRVSYEEGGQTAGD